MIARGVGDPPCSQQTRDEPRGAESYEQQRTGEGGDAESRGASFEDGQLWIRRMNGDANAVTRYVSRRGAARRVECE
jgi:hypothetical protein